MPSNPEQRAISIDDEIWQIPFVIQWTQLLLDSFRHWTKRELIERHGTPVEQAQQLFTSSFVLVSHGPQEDPILNYGNRSALVLWEMKWDQFITTPSRLTAETINQAERAQMLHRATQQGFIDDYRGIRISKTGRKFLVEHATVWNVVDPQLHKHGQAAMFSTWSFLES